MSAKGSVFATSEPRGFECFVTESARGKHSRQQMWRRSTPSALQKNVVTTRQHLRASMSVTESFITLVSIAFECLIDRERTREALQAVC